MNWKTFSADYFTFSKKDRLALLIFVGLLGLLYGAARIFPTATPIAVREDTVLNQMLDSAASQAANTQSDLADASSFRYEVSKKNEPVAGELFSFNPNTLDEAGWQRLGLRQRTIQTVLKYRSKGGHFYIKEDLKKIWGLSPAFYDRVSPYIVLNEAKKNFEGSENFFKTPYAKAERTIAVVDINTADTTAFIALPGIGPTLARRIIAFRSRLGGFYAINQLGETYGLPDSTFQKLKPYLQQKVPVKTMALNTVSKEELKSHPYFKWNLANAIVEYRTQHGLFKNIDELNNIALVDEATFERIAPYLTL